MCCGLRIPLSGDDGGVVIDDDVVVVVVAVACFDRCCGCWNTS